MELGEIKLIQEQHLNGQWPQFLESIEISGLRGWSGQVIDFKFPIVAIVGENGTGKSTILKVAACAYKNESGASYYPSTFFMETQWDRIYNVAINYRIRRGDAISTFKITKPSLRWSYPEKQFKRSVFIYDVSRTLPLDATAGYAKIAKQASDEVSSSELNEEYRKGLSRILGKEYFKARFAATDVNKAHEVGLLTRDFGEVSQFHQGAGEDTTLDLFRSLQKIPDYSLLIIDEVEASLHPKAQRRLIRFLLWFCRQKKVQIILSTHSPYVLEELPREARVLLLPGANGSSNSLNIVYGISTEFAMSYIDENSQPELHIFMEDKEAVTLLREIIVSHPEGSELLHRIAIRAVGPANVVQVLGRLGKSNRLPYKSMCFLDGDIADSEGCMKLPGSTAPEIVIFNDLKAKNWPNLTERFGIGAGDLFTFFEDAMLNPDHHEWTTEIGNHVKKSSNGVWEILTREWCKCCLNDDERNKVITSIKDALS